MEVLNKVLALIPVLNPTYALVISVAVEVIMRIWPTAQPASLLLVVSAAVKKAGEYVSKVGEIIAKISGLLDSVVQVVKPPQA